MAFATGDLLGRHFLSRRRYFPGADDWWSRAKNAEVAGDRAVVGVGDRGLRQPGGRVRGHSRLYPARLELVWQPGIRILGSWAFLADSTHARPVLLGVNALLGTARPPPDGTQRKPPVVVLVLRPGHTGFLCRGVAGAAREPFHNHRLGASGSCIFGSRIFWSFSPQSWWPAFSFCWEWWRNVWP